MADTFSRFFSGVVINQNTPVEAIDDHVALASPVYQTFRLPLDYRRVGTQTPEVTGVQVRVAVTSLDAQVTVRLEHKPFIGDWVTLAEGPASAPAVVDDEVWLTCLFDTPVSAAGLEDDTFRIRVSDPQNVSYIWYTVPNPLPAFGGPKAYTADAVTPIYDTGREVALGFRVLGAVADSGTDFLGNRYRSAVTRKGAESSDPTSAQDAFYLSGPQPSKFAVVSQYWDVQDDGAPTVIDSVLIDPVTPGVWVHAYFCNDGDPGMTDDEWEERVWTPVPRAYHALRRDSYVFPEPVTARYIKLEYTHLQATSYPVGGFQRPVNYKKHPKWVLDYFLLATAAATSDSAFVARSVTVDYDAYSLAFDYYKDDLGSDVAPPPLLSADDKAQVEQFVSDRGDQSDVIDSATRAQINTIMQPYLLDARTRTTARTLLGEAVTTDDSSPAYPVESLPGPTPVGTAVSSIDREAVVFEQSFPVMFFYIPCRHRYRVMSAEFSEERAYFVGIREVSFSRARYSVQSDQRMYTETLGDYANAERNDFIPPAAPVPPPPPVPH